MNWSDCDTSPKRHGSLSIWFNPDFFTLGRRRKTIDVKLSARRNPGPLDLLFPLGHCCAMPCRAVDRTGIKLLGDGEWLARTHGTRRRRQQRKVHLAMGTATSDIRAVECTSSREGDSPVLPDLLDQFSEDGEIGTGVVAQN